VSPRAGTLLAWTLAGSVAIWWLGAGLAALEHLQSAIELSADAVAAVLLLQCFAMLLVGARAGTLAPRAAIAPLALLLAVPLPVLAVAGAAANLPLPQLTAAEAAVGGLGALATLAGAALARVPLRWLDAPRAAALLAIAACVALFAFRTEALAWLTP
jgi:hypothetical protein